MAIQELEPELLDGLRVEFGKHGRRASDLLSEAHALLVSDWSGCRRREVVAHCLREAMKELLASVGSMGAGRWRQVSRGVVDARERYGNAVGLPGEDVVDALRDLLVSIDSLGRFHDEEEGLHERRLIAVMVNRTGAVPLSGGTEPVRAYQNLLRRLDRAAHGGRGQESTEDLWVECAAILRRFFFPPETRHVELERLALIAHPTTADRDAVLDLVSSPRHLQYFLGETESPGWLEVLGAAGVLDPSDIDGLWPPHAAVVGLSETYPREVSAWLHNMYRSHGSSPARAVQICQAALAAGGSALDLVLAAVRDHQEHAGVLWSGVRAAMESDGSASLVDDLADVILNPKSSAAAAHFIEPLLEQISAGINERNSQSRVAVLTYKIRSLPNDEWLLRKLEWQPSGSIADTRGSSVEDRSRLLLSCLLDLLESAWMWTPASDLLDTVGKLPDSGLRRRLRAWVLANAPDVDPSLIIAEVEHAISFRSPTGDDVPLLDRAATDCEASIYTDRWREALGPSPDAEEIGHALTADDVHKDWLRALRWAPLLPAGVAGAWATAWDILSPRSGRPSREALTQRTPDSAEIAVSPISAEELRSMDPDSAARWIAEWRPNPTAWPSGPRELARTLESVVKDNIEDWTSTPIRTVVNLCHPTYITHYLYALTSAVPKQELPVGDLLDVIKLVRTHPWPVEPLAASHLDYATDWRETERAAVSLIEALADSDRGFDSRADEAWAVLVSETTNRSEPSDIISISTGPEPLTSAGARPCTRALQAVLSFVAHEFRSSGVVRREAIALFEESLRLTGVDGVENRAVLASRIGLLRHVLPDWTETNRDLLFGRQAPDGLGQLTIEQAIQWSQPNRWLLENFPDPVRNAVRQGADRAMEHMIIAMLWGCPGYSVQETAAFLNTSPDLVSKSGRALGSVLNDADTNRRLVAIAVDYWKTILDTETGAAVEGFGTLSEVSAMHAQPWEELTLRTIKAADGRIDWSHGIVKRLVASHPTITGLAVLNEMVRGRLDDWERMYVAEKAATVLSRANDLQETDEYKRLRTTLLERGITDD